VHYQTNGICVYTTSVARELLLRTGISHVQKCLRAKGEHVSLCKEGTYE
jgi:hypothetical protein